MGKHSIEKPKKKLKLKKIFTALLVIIVIIFGINFILSHKNIEKQPQNQEMPIKTSKTIEGKKLVIKSNSEYNKIVEYTFENNVLKTVKVYEQFENNEKFKETKKNYEMVNNIEIINTNEQELSIEIEKKDFGSDTGMSYEQLYDKYLVQIIGAYEIIK